MAQADIDKRTPIPRGLARTGPVLLSYGFRPFFLAAGVWGLGAMALWIIAMMGYFDISARYGASAWHAHEMLFGYTSAALAGFLLTAVPNWTGRLPVSGLPLLALFLLWCAGRLALLLVDQIGLLPSIFIDAAFLPALLAICAREIIAGKKWKDLKILGGLLVLTLANWGFHACIAVGVGPELPGRMATAAYLMLIMIVGGRILPSFTRNWLNKNGHKVLPAPYSNVDTVALLVSLVALVAWVAFPELVWTGVIALIAAAAQAVRLARWRGWAARAEGLVLVLHVAYLFVVLGFLAVAATAFGLLDAFSSLHVFTAGCIGSMTLAVMSRATRGHTGLDLHASPVTVASYVSMAIAGSLRPIAGLLPEFYMPLISAAGLCWMLAFLLYLVEYAPALTGKRRDLPMVRGKD